jgi:hypothetical protein
MPSASVAIPFPSTEVDSAAASNNPSIVDVNVTNGVNGADAPNGLVAKGPGEDRRGSGAGLPVSDGEIGIVCFLVSILG